MSKPKLRVGFDLDGVILYNPARIARPLVVFFKKKLGINQNKFYLPKNRTQRFIWLLLHHSSLFAAPGFEELKQLIHAEKIEAYIISARYEFLKKDFVSWLNRIDAKKHFKRSLYNDDNEQPYVFKERVIRKLDLDYFVEDNWDVVRNLNQKGNRTKVLWLYNFFDRKIDYPYKFSSLRKAVLFLKNRVSEK